MKKIYVITKYILAETMQEAEKKEKRHKVDEIELQVDSKRMYMETITEEKNNIGYKNK